MGDTAEKFTAKVKLASREARVKLMFEGPVLPLDRVPATEEALMSSTSCFTVHYRAMRPILSVTQVGENRFLSWSVDFLAEVDLIKKPEDEICFMNQQLVTCLSLKICALNPAKQENNKHLLTL